MPFLIWQNVYEEQTRSVNSDYNIFEENNEKFVLNSFVWVILTKEIWERKEIKTLSVIMNAMKNI